MYSHKNPNIVEECLVTFLTCLDINVLDVQKLAKKTIETGSLTELHLFLSNYLIEKQSQLGIKKIDNKKLVNLRSSWNHGQFQEKKSI